MDPKSPKAVGVNPERIDIGTRMQLIQGAATQYEAAHEIETYLAQIKILDQQIAAMEEQAKAAVIEKERWNAVFNTMMMELRRCYDEHNKLVEKIASKN
ncbi:hypothetical protein [Paenibacillus sp. NPDC057967]|uniref:hypothetical protein n=1 Tax=Paenibacillus sp. NPDC057967 TaxID=3346293 RepID=UPI0036DB94B2